MKYWEHQGKMQLFEISENNALCGLFITVIYDDLVLIDYLAVRQDLRGKGIGSEALKLARKMYEGKCLFLEIESTKKPCPDIDSRQKRKNFYLKNGLSDSGFSVNLFGVEMEILCFERKITFDKYLSLYRYMAGKILKPKITLIED